MSWARAYVAAPGCATVFLNGQTPKVDTRGVCAWAVAGSNNVGKLANTRYMTHDITNSVVAGATNCIGLWNSGSMKRQWGNLLDFVNSSARTMHPQGAVSVRADEQTKPN